MPICNSCEFFQKRCKMHCNVHCSSAYKVCLATKCHKQYVRETVRSLKDRLNNHRSDVKQKNNCHCYKMQRCTANYS